MLKKRYLELSIVLFAIAVFPYSMLRAQEAWRPVKAAIEAANAIDEATIRSHIRFLSDDLLEGRGPASRGDQLSQLYISTQFQALGLKPAGTVGWIQPVPLVGVVTKAPAKIEFKHRKGAGDDKSNIQFKYYEEYIAVAGRPVEAVGFEDREVVFVGYGIQAPEFGWDDFKGMDLKGKILLMMNNDPANDPAMFGGKKRLYYGRWDYKFESAARQGAAGAIIIHTNESAGYPFSVIQTSWTGEEFELRESEGPRLDMKGWLTDEATKKLVEASGFDLDKLRTAAERKDFKPVSLGTDLSIQLRCAIREQDTANVLGLLEGSDPQLKKEVVIYMAHHDHIGMAAQRNESGDMIYNGAIDNASGSATLLSIAKAYSQMENRPKRSILFAAVGAEEQGLLGSKYFAEHPTLQPGRMAAVINMDGITFLGRTKDVNVVGDGKSDLDKVLAGVTEWQKRIVTPDHSPDKGYYYRSDQFSLAKIGVPAIYLHAGIRVLDKPENWGKDQLEEWTKKHYHQPSDEYSESWDLRGAVEDAQLLYHVGNEIANQDSLPSWTPGDEFEAARKEALRALPKD